MVSTGSTRRVRIVVAEPGDGAPDDASARVARALRDAGHEVVYTGPGHTPEQIAETAIQEDADLVAVVVAVVADGPADAAPERAIVARLADRDASDIVVRVFPSGTPAGEIAGRVAEEFSG